MTPFMKLSFVLLFFISTPLYFLYAQVQVETILPNLNASGGLTQDLEGHLYVSDFGPGNSIDSNTVVYKIDKTDFSVSVFSDGFIGASGACFDSQGNFYQANNNGNRLSKIHPDGTKEMDWVTGLNLPIGVIADTEDNIFVCNCGGNTITKVTANGTASTFAADPLFNCPNGLTIDEENNLYACNFSDGKVLKITPEGIVSLVTELPVLSGGPNPVGNGHLTYKNNYLWVNLIGRGQVYRVCKSGETALVAGQAFGFDNVDGASLTAKFSKPNGIIASVTGDTLFLNCSVPTWATNPAGLHPGMLRMIRGINTLTDDLCVDSPVNESLFSELMEGAIVNELYVSQGSAWADYDLDGDMDVFVTVGNNMNNRLYRNDGDLNFTLVDNIVSNDGGNSSAAIWGDYNNDSYPDIYVSNNATPPLAAEANFLYRNDGPPNFGFTKIITELPATLANYTWSSSWVDFDNDGDLDLHVPENRHLTTDFFFENNGIPNTAGQYFTQIQPDFITNTVESTGVASWMDYDQDCDQDLFLIKSGRSHPDGEENNRVFHNQLTETGALDFEPVLTAAMVNHLDKDFQASWGDYDNDSDMDVYLGNFDGPNYLYRNEGDSLFTLVESGSPVEDNSATLGSTWADFDNDGDLDLFVGNTLGQASIYYENDGSGNFSKPGAALVGPPITNLSGTQSVSVADVNNDGNLDLFLANAVITPTQIARDFMYLNNGGGYNFLMLQLQGTTSNTSAIGAKVYIKSTIDGNSIWQMRVRTGSPTGDRAQSSDRIHFGLRESELVDTLIIEWPNCQRSVYANVLANQICTIQEDGTTDCNLDFVEAAIELPEAAFQMNILQNPIQDGQLIVTFNQTKADIVQFYLMDIGGRLLRSQFMDQKEGQININVEELPKGIYLISARTTQGWISRKFVID